MGARGFFPWGGKRPKREADHSPPISAKAKKMFIYTSTSPYVLIEQCLLSYAQRKLYLLHLRTVVKQETRNYSLGGTVVEPTGGELKFIKRSFIIDFDG
jgi:hypothetical protein